MTPCAYRKCDRDATRGGLCVAHHAKRLVALRRAQARQARR